MVDIAEILSRGGEARIALLRYCVMSITPEAVFLFLVQQYRLPDAFVRAGAVRRLLRTRCSRPRSLAGGAPAAGPAPVSGGRLHPQAVG
jgi:hypothetical protein